MNTELPIVVALVPAFNAASFIEETLDSIAAQSYSNLRVLISDDASTDETGKICDRYATTDARFSVLHQSLNLGWIGNVNALFEAAEGDYYFFAFHDDIFLPDYVQLLVEALEADPGAILAFPDIEYVKSDGTVGTPSFRELDGVTNRYERVRVMARKPQHNAIPVLGIFRSDAPGLVGGLKRNLAGEFVADWPWLLSLLVHGTFIRVPRILCRKIVRETGVVSGWSNNPLSRLAVMLSCATVIRTAPFSRREKWRLYLTLFLSYPLLPWIQIRRWLSKRRLLKRIYFKIRT